MATIPAPALPLVAADDGHRLPSRASGSRSVLAARMASQAYECVFLAQMLRPMFDQLNVSAPFGGGFAEEMWRSLLVDEYGRAMSRAGGVGVADVVMRELVRAQGSFNQMEEANDGR